MRNLLIWGMSCLLFAGCHSIPSNKIPKGAYRTISAKDTHKNIILLTLEGVRWQEFFHGTDPDLDQGASEKVIFKNLMQRLSVSGMAIGDRENGSEMVVSNSALISLPAYQSIMSGLTLNCLTNSCPRVPVKTVQERLMDSLNLERNKVVTFASWSKIALAAEHQEGHTIVNAGMSRFEDPLQDAEVDSINGNQFLDEAPWSGARFDKYTTQLALWYLKKYQPRFLTISLNDSDEWAHRGDYAKYVDALHQFDDFIENLLSTLEQLGEYGQSTTVLITTDHGRGSQDKWRSHGTSAPESKYVWLAAVGPALKNRISTLQVYRHNDFLPTILAIMGIEAYLCKECGVPIAELVSSLKE